LGAATSVEKAVNVISGVKKEKTVAGNVNKAGDVIKCEVDDLKLKINIGQQNKHIPGTNNYKQELANGKLKSILSADPQQLIDDFAGTGKKLEQTRNVLILET